VLNYQARPSSDPCFSLPLIACRVRVAGTEKEGAQGWKGMRLDKKWNKSPICSILVTKNCLMAK